jgi:uncharacterized phage protein (TIGR01671 family)
MREILFKGKDIDTDKWIYGFYGEGDEFWDNGGVEHMYREGVTKLYYIVDKNSKSHLVYPETVGQYTGLAYENDNKIFEGDIVKYFGRKGYILYMNGVWFISFNEGGYRQLSDLYRSLKIIGNIHDNKELLGG